MQKILLKKIDPRSITTLLLVGIGAVGFAALAWVEPTAVPPSSNTAPPIRADNTNQHKYAALSLTSIDATVPALSVTGNSLIQATGYANWGNTAGSGGYGFRSNSGAMQFKNGSGASWTTWTNLGTATTYGQYAYSAPGSAYAWSPCHLTSAASSTGNIICENLGTINQAKTNGWTEEDPAAAGADTYLYKVIPGQTSAPWTFCSMNGYTTAYDWNTQALIVRKPDNKWYMYFGEASWGTTAMNVIANCWR